MTIFSILIFLLLETLLEVSASYSVSGLYRGVWYQPVEDHALLGQSIMNTIPRISAVGCSVRCLSHHGCFSFNYDHINQVCQMNNFNGEHACDKLKGMPNVSYFDATAPPKMCQHNTVSGYCYRSSKACSVPEKLGLEDESIPDESLSASSNWEPNGPHKGRSTAAGGRLNRVPPSVDINANETIIGAWHPAVADRNQWIQVDLGYQTYVTAVLTQGRYDGTDGHWVTRYKMQFEPPALACLVFVKDKLGQTQIFIGNTDKNTIVRRSFFKPVLAVKIRVLPTDWQHFIGLRFELLGCK